MRIATTGLDLPEGKVKYDDPDVAALAAKFDPAKTTPYYVELLPDDFEQAECIAVARDALLDLLIHDMEKLENRSQRSADAGERRLLTRVIGDMESGVPVCDQVFDPAEDETVRTLAPYSLKPTFVVEDAAVGLDELVPAVMRKAGLMFFYTAGKQEVHSWLVRSGDNAQTCAGRIHSDLARGFVKAEILTVDQMLGCHSMQDARRKGITRLVDRDYVIPERTVLEIRFSV